RLASVVVLCVSEMVARHRLRRFRVSARCCSLAVGSDIRGAKLNERTMKTLSASLCVAFCFATANAYGASAAYDFSTLHIAVPGPPEMVAYPDDINDKGEILSNIRVNNLTEALITGQPTNRRNTKFK